MHVDIRKTPWAKGCNPVATGTVQLTTHFHDWGVNHIDFIELNEQDLHIAYEDNAPQIRVVNAYRGTAEQAKEPNVIFPVWVPPAGEEHLPPLTPDDFINVFDLHKDSYSQKLRAPVIGRFYGTFGDGARKIEVDCALTDKTEINLIFSPRQYSIPSFVVNQSFYPFAEFREQDTQTGSAS